jgi:hypothetical protein
VAAWIVAGILAAAVSRAAQEQAAPAGPPTGPLRFGVFTAVFSVACSMPTMCRPGTRSTRQRLPVVGIGYSASPVAADGKLYLSSEDGEVLVVSAGPAFAHISTNPMGETLMATPALSDGVMYVRGSSSLIAVGRR